jgi:hypothetical protein
MGISSRRKRASDSLLSLEINSDRCEKKRKEKLLLKMSPKKKTLKTYEVFHKLHFHIVHGITTFHRQQQIQELGKVIQLDHVHDRDSSK